jgi:glycosyltransferase involved in cell wall biosynthesis
MSVCRLGVLASHFIQYNSPFYRELAKDPRIELVVYYLNEHGRIPRFDEGFGETFEWDIPLDQGYAWQLLSGAGGRLLSERALRCDLEIARLPWLGTADAFLLLVDYSKPSVLAFMYSCLFLDIPILYRGDTTLLHERKNRRRLKRLLLGPSFRRNVWGLYVGRLAREYIRDLGVPSKRQIFSPHCVDSVFWSTRATQWVPQREELRRMFGLPVDQPVVLFSGRVVELKRPLDLAIALCGLAEKRPVSLLVAGSGELLQAVRSVVDRCPQLSRCFLGFLNQSELARAYAAADIIALPAAQDTWGLVINEAMYFDCVPIVSSMVGCAPDLVEGVGEIHPVGDIETLKACIARVIDELPARQALVPARIAHYSLDRSVEGIIEAALRSTGQQVVVPSHG